jgi:hypothetical protein
MKLFTTLALFFSIISFVNQNAEANRKKVPGWHRYTLATSSPCKQDLPGKGVEVQGDFNGDHLPDTAFLEVNEKLKQTQLIVNFGGTRKDEDVVLQTWEGANPSVAIARVSAKEQKIWCGKAATCEDDDAHAVHLKNDSIRFIHCGSAEDLFYWDSVQKKFTLVEIAETTSTALPIRN